MSWMPATVPNMLSEFSTPARVMNAPSSPPGCQVGDAVRADERDVEQARWPMSLAELAAAGDLGAAEEDDVEVGRRLRSGSAVKSWFWCRSRCLTPGDRAAERLELRAEGVRRRRRRMPRCRPRRGRCARRGRCRRTARLRGPGCRPGSRRGSSCARQGSSGRYCSEPSLVRSTPVLAGLHWARPASLVTGIWRGRRSS